METNPHHDQTSTPPGLPAQPPPGLPLSVTTTGYGTPPAVTEDDRTMGMLCHLLGILTGIVGPLILWLVKKDQSPFINHHGKEALNFAISILLYSLIAMGILMVVTFVTMGFGLIIFMPLYLAFVIGVLVVVILACRAAYRGEWHRYPMTIRFIP